MHQEMIGDSQWSSWCAPYLGFLDACFLPEIGIVGAGWDWKGRRIGCGGARGPNPRTQIATKNNCRVEKWTTKGDFFLTPARNL